MPAAINYCWIDVTVEQSARTMRFENELMQFGEARLAATPPGAHAHSCSHGPAVRHIMMTTSIGLSKEVVVGLPEATEENVEHKEDSAFSARRCQCGCSKTIKSTTWSPRPSSD